MCDYTMERAGAKRLLNMDCAKCGEAASLGNPACMKAVLEALNVEKPDELVLTKEFRKIFPRKETAMLRELAAAVAETKRRYASLTTLGACDVCLAARRKALAKFYESLETNPAHAYFLGLKEEYSTAPDTAKCRACLTSYKAAVERLLEPLEATAVIREAKKQGAEREIYHKLFVPVTQPPFISSYVDYEIPEGSKLLTSYRLKTAEVEIYGLAARPEKLYFVKAPELRVHEDENRLLSEALDRISAEETRIVNPREARERFRVIANQVLSRHKGIEEKRLGELADIIARYSAGYGLLEILLSDDRLQDVFIDSPGDSNIYVYHQDFEECITNIVPSRFELEKLSARFRALSGRPFDESAPVLHTELEDLGVRVAGVCPPATFDGVGFAFRRHRPMPWTLPQFIRAGMLDAEVAGLLSFLIDGQRSVLVTGPRGSGKTSLLAALLAEVSPNFRVMVIEDTPELPVDQLRHVGYKIQHLRTEPSFGTAKGGYELTAEEALRTALRLGESVLALGEVRGPEARALFEAMRVGAAGNVVMGTIHGSSPYDTWDRIVNDLGVPSTSFKATDVVVSIAALRRSDEVRRYRRLVTVTEVGKHWREDPFHEKGFSDLVEYDSRKDGWKVADDLKKFDVVRDVAALKSMSLDEAIRNIACRTEVKKMLVSYAEKLKAPDLLEIGAVTACNNEYLAAVGRHTNAEGKTNYAAITNDMDEWIKRKGKALARAVT